MVEQELRALIQSIQTRGCEGQTTEVKSARKGCPEKLYDTISAFSNQNSGGTLVFGLDESKIEGQVFKILGHSLESYASELTKSIRFFQTKYLNSKVGGIVLSGHASQIPLFPEYIEARTNVPTMSGNPWQLVRTSAEQQQALAPVASEFAVVIGLSERSND